ncbi:hypothetical protein [Stackebrandtia soli]|uniref:hypothetical protein n=1 Tax=Stackebrandtia soli TaxID=1892856 RepID=UPI0039E9A93D
MRRTTTVTTTVLALMGSALTGCSASGEPRVEPESGPTEAPAPDVFRESVDTGSGDDPGVASMHGFLSDHDGRTVQLDVLLVRVRGADDLSERDDDRIAVTFPPTVRDEGDYELIVDAAVLPLDGAHTWLPLRGEFTVEEDETEDGMARFDLTTVAPLAKTPTLDEERCASAETEERLITDAELLVDNPDVYESLREDWAEAPRVWWALKATAEVLAVMDDGTVGDGLATACADYAS